MNNQETHPILGFFKSLLNRHSWLTQLLLLPELYSFLLAMLQLVFLAEHYLILSAYSPKGASHLWKILGYHLTGGAAFGALKGASFPDLTLIDNILANSLITSIIILLFNTLFSLSCRGIFKIKFLEHTISSMKSDAKTHKRGWKALGIPGIFIFVLFPTTGTGPIVGSILGRLIGLKFWTNILTVIAGSFASIISVAFAADKIEKFIGDKQLSRITFVLFLLIIVGALTAQVIAWRKSLKADSQSGADQNAGKTL